LCCLINCTQVKKQRTPLKRLALGSEHASDSMYTGYSRESPPVT
jgi:hypothetical protein